ncbi:MAG: hypothetical protein V2A54_11785 [Bacteroidota bacterium]
MLEKILYKFHNSRVLKYTAVATLFVASIFIAFLSNGVEGGADSYTHYLISKYASLHPVNFLNHWGKPVFTLLIFPFTFFGITFAKIYNILAIFICAYFVFRTLKILNYPYAFLGFFITLFMPALFILQFSTLTEPTFALLISVGIFLFFRKNYIASSIIMSFIFLVRTESIVMYPLFFIAFLAIKKYKAIPFLASGFLLYSVIGYFVYGDFLWLITQMPYTGANAGIYGSGSLFHYYNNRKFITGEVIGALVVAGLLYLVYIFIFRKEERKISALQLILIAAPAIAFFAAHSYVWWKGNGSSLGLLRVMASIAPLFALLAMAGIQAADKHIFRHGSLYNLIKLSFIPFIAYIAIHTFPVPIKANATDREVIEASNWIKNSPYSSRKIGLYNGTFAYYTDKDLFSNNEVQWLFGTSPEKDISPGTIVIWDAHFGPNEGQTKRETLLNSKYFRVLNYFEPIEPIHVLNNYLYEIILFERLKDSTNIDNYALIEQIKQKNFDKKYAIKEIANTVFIKHSLITKSDTLRGFIMNKDSTFCHGFSAKASALSDKDFIIEAIADFYIPAGSTAPKVSIVASGLSKDNSAYLYQQSDMEAVPWWPDSTITLRVKMEVRQSDLRSRDDEIKVYTWYRSDKDRVLLKRIKVNFIYPRNQE